MIDSMMNNMYISQFGGGGYAILDKKIIFPNEQNQQEDSISKSSVHKPYIYFNHWTMTIYNRVDW